MCYLPKIRCVVCICLSTPLPQGDFGCCHYNSWKTNLVKLFLNLHHFGCRHKHRQLLPVVQESRFEAVLGSYLIFLLHNLQFRFLRNLKIKEPLVMNFFQISEANNLWFHFFENFQPVPGLALTLHLSIIVNALSTRVLLRICSLILPFALFFLHLVMFYCTLTSPGLWTSTKDQVTSQVAYAKGLSVCNIPSSNCNLPEVFMTMDPKHV
jgi:hypothetical protein